MVIYTVTFTKFSLVEINQNAGHKSNINYLLFANNFDIKAIIGFKTNCLFSRKMFSKGEEDFERGFDNMKAL